MNTIIKYSGGKSKEIPFFEKYIPKDFDTYIEPFFGGGAVFFHLEPKKAIINDINKPLIHFYEGVSEKYDVVRKQLDKLQAIYEENQEEYLALKSLNPDKRVENKNEALYYEIRDMFNDKTVRKYHRSVIYFFINKTAYSGMIRYNSRGEFNVPFGRYKNLNTKMITKEHSDLLSRAKIFSTDYSNIFRMAKENDFIFLDPPYDCVFNDYGNLEAKDGFNEEEHRRLANDFRKLKCKALMIIGKTPLTEELYGEFIKGEYKKTYSVNIRNRFKSVSKHIIVTNYDIKD